MFEMQIEHGAGLLSASAGARDHQRIDHEDGHYGDMLYRTDGGGGQRWRLIGP